MAASVNVPGALIRSVENAARPATAFTVSVPLSVPGLEPAPSAIVIASVAVVTRAPAASTTSTLTGGPPGA